MNVGADFHSSSYTTCLYDSYCHSGWKHVDSVSVLGCLAPSLRVPDPLGYSRRYQSVTEVKCAFQGSWGLCWRERKFLADRQALAQETKEPRNKDRTRDDSAVRVLQPTYVRDYTLREKNPDFQGRRLSGGLVAFPHLTTFS